ncbi:DExH-box ATP-dependent RNA helicase DExH3 [Selaginella moellendorffii]|uniref:DExH-box ATP-dependent RNA helicase DExH3 n=1 Tax=Selaginella moellendorffii TaxID=88036 RepID=UPI000D1C9346|nr:DExH-box ATP-dependent RNA helicase DExH3 [Selaginella moellendorffii]|eukprot:XP_024515116.1 DExH-box ATP-dependent RNA helicase DExH3 [Selaginella moellendorffii]
MLRVLRFHPPLRSGRRLDVAARSSSRGQEQIPNWERLRRLMQENDGQAGSSFGSSSSSSYFQNDVETFSNPQSLPSPNFPSGQQRRALHSMAFNRAQPRGYYEYSEDDDLDDRNGGPPAENLHYVNLDEWRLRLTKFLRNKEQTEIISREARDRRYIEPLTLLAKEMGLHCQMFGKAVAISKKPLPHYRPDLDDKRPQREVSFSILTHRRTNALLEQHLRLKRMSADTSRRALRGPERSASSYEESPTTTMQRSRRLEAKMKEWEESEEGQKMMTIRRNLPSFKEKAGLLEVIAKNQVVVISGETGCGKTTQLPQYILEAEIEAGRGGSCNIICTQPRRISAVSVAERVASERGEVIGETIGYQVRLEGIRSRNTRLLFCTTGILLRRLLTDPSLKGVTHVIVDEIHERGMNEDFLLVILKELLPQRPDLRLVLMSATLNAELFSKYFSKAPTAHIPGFTYPVKSHFLEDVLDLTGYRLNQFNQVDDYGQDKLWKMQKQLAARKRKSPVAALAEEAMASQAYNDRSAGTRESLSCWNSDILNFNLIQATLLHICKQAREGAVLVFMTGWEDISALLDKLKQDPVLGDSRKVLLLGCHGSMATAEQKLIFEHPPPGVRKIVLATNMAETSITINDVVFVVDVGKAKETSYDALNNTPCLLPTWISKASSRQRRGRAGRVKPGECYHLYPKAVHEAFAEYQLPELLRTPLHSLCLQIKSLQLGDVAMFLSKAMQPPENLAVKNALEYLTTIGALDEQQELTDLGRILALLPVEPRLGKMLIMGSIFRCLDPVLTIAAGLAARDPFIMPMDKRNLADQAKYDFAGREASDHIGLVRAFEGWEAAMSNQVASSYCWKNFLSMQTLLGMSSLRKQFIGLLTTAGLITDDLGFFNRYSQDPVVLRAVICSGLFPGVASVMKKQKSVLYKTIEDGQVLLSASSVNSRDFNPKNPWLMYSEKIKMSSVMVRDSTCISDSTLLLFGGKLIDGHAPGHILMQGSYLEFFMKVDVANTVMRLRQEMDKLILRKLANPSMDIYTENKELVDAAFELMRGDDCSGSFVFGRATKGSGFSKGSAELQDKGTPDTKGILQTLVQRAGFAVPTYQTRSSGSQFISCVVVRGKKFIGEPAESKKQAEKNAAAMAAEWLTSLPRMQDVLSAGKYF